MMCDFVVLVVAHIQNTFLLSLLHISDVQFIKCLEEGYNCGMIRMELTKNGTLDTLMRHELTHEEVGVIYL